MQGWTHVFAAAIVASAALTGFAEFGRGAMPVAGSPAGLYGIGIGIVPGFVATIASGRRLPIEILR